LSLNGFASLVYEVFEVFTLIHSAALTFTCIISHFCTSLKCADCCFY